MTDNQKNELSVIVDSLYDIKFIRAHYFVLANYY